MPGNGTSGEITLADKFGIVWLAGAGFLVAAITVFVMAPPESFSPAIPANRLYNEILLPSFWLVTILSAMEVFGKKKVRSLLDRWGGSGGD